MFLGLDSSSFSQPSYIPSYSSKSNYVLPNKSIDLHVEASLLTGQKEFTGAIQIYNSLINDHPDASGLYSARATALMERKWFVTLKRDEIWI